MFLEHPDLVLDLKVEHLGLGFMTSHRHPVLLLNVLISVLCFTLLAYMLLKLSAVD